MRALGAQGPVLPQTLLCICACEPAPGICVMPSCGRWPCEAQVLPLAGMSVQPDCVPHAVTVSSDCF